MKRKVRNLRIGYSQISRGIRVPIPPAPMSFVGEPDAEGVLFRIFFPNSGELDKVSFFVEGADSLVEIRLFAESVNGKTALMHTLKEGDNFLNLQVQVERGDKCTISVENMEEFVPGSLRVWLGFLYHINPRDVRRYTIKETPNDASEPEGEGHPANGTEEKLPGGERRARLTRTLQLEADPARTLPLRGPDATDSSGGIGGGGDTA